MDGRQRVEARLREEGVQFQVQHHSPAYTAQEAAAVLHIPGRAFAKSVVAVADGKLIMLVLPAPAKVDLQRVRSTSRASNVRLAREEEFINVFPDCDPGAMSPLGVLYGLPVYVDNALARCQSITFLAGTHTDSVTMRYRDFERLVSPVLGEFSQPELAAPMAA